MSTSQSTRLSVRVMRFAFAQITAIAAIGFSTAGHSSPITYDEAISGDLPYIPASIFALDVGTNTFSGQIGVSSAGAALDLDSIAFRVSTGSQLTQILLGPGSPVGSYAGTTIGLNSGPSINSGTALRAVSDHGIILQNTISSALPLGAGTYTIGSLALDLGSPMTPVAFNNWTLLLQVSSVAPPSPPVVPQGKAFAFPLRSVAPVYLITEAGGESSDCTDGCVDSFHFADSGYYSLDFDNTGQGNSADVLAAAGGVVVRKDILTLASGKLYQVLTIKHDDGYFTEYAEFFHNYAEVPVSVGDSVVKGQKIGELPSGAGRHLHFQVKYDPTGSGLTAGLSKKSITQLADVTVGGRLFKDYMLDHNASGTPLSTLLYGQTLPLLPTNDSSNRAFQFNVVVGDLGVGLSLPIYVDPEVAIGYDYEILSGPLFASLILPSVGDDLFELWLFDFSVNAYIFDQILSAGIWHSFGLSGVDRFRILGIEQSANLDPTDPTAFVTGLTFAVAGEVSFTQTPIQVSISEPATVALFCVALAGLGFSRRRKLH